MTQDLAMLTSLIFSTVAMQASAAPHNPATFFIFLVRAPNPPKATKEEIEGYQTAHINNFKRLYGMGKLLTAGPMQDPTQQKRGIVVFCVDKEKEVLESFAPDPYVQKGFMNVEVHSIKPQFGKFGIDGIDPNGIVENRIAVFEVGDSKTKMDAKAHLDYVRSADPKVELAFFGDLGKSKSLKAVALFRGKDDATIKSWLDSDPFVKSGVWKYVLMPQWLSKGIL